MFWIYRKSLKRSQKWKTKSRSKCTPSVFFPTQTLDRHKAYQLVREDKMRIDFFSFFKFQALTAHYFAFSHSHTSTNFHPIRSIIVFVVKSALKVRKLGENELSTPLLSLSYRPFFNDTLTRKSGSYLQQRLCSSILWNWIWPGHLWHL